MQSLRGLRRVGKDALGVAYCWLAKSPDLNGSRFQTRGLSPWSPGCFSAPCHSYLLPCPLHIIFPLFISSRRCLCEPLSWLLLKRLTFT